jgi:hypothetical protein
MDRYRQIIRGQIKSEIDSAIRSYEMFHESRDVGDIPKTFDHIHHFLVHVANISKFLDTRNNERRAGAVEGLVRHFGDQLQIPRSLRNDLEHFDERLETWLGKHPTAPFFDRNLITGSSGFPRDLSLRTLDGDVYEMYGRGYNLRELKELLDSAAKLLQRE